jgi:hypothetical protein
MQLDPQGTIPQMTRLVILVMDSCLKVVLSITKNTLLRFAPQNQEKSVKGYFYILTLNHLVGANRHGYRRFRYFLKVRMK